MPMLQALNTAVTGLQQFQRQIDVIGNNISNVDTTGYKDERIDFEDTLSNALGTDSSLQMGTGVATAGISSNFSQGSISSTGVASDLAIDGNGFFVVRNSSSNAQYATRDGSFSVDASGYLVTSGGLRVQGYTDTGLTTTGDIKIDATGAPSSTASGATMSSYAIDSNGKITVTMSDGTTFVRGQVLMQNYTDPDALVKAGDNLYTATSAAGGLSQLSAAKTSGLGSIEADSLESSNVDLTTEMSNLITAQRAFEANSKIVTTSDEVLQTLVNLKR